MTLDGGPPLNGESHSWKMRLRAGSLSLPGAAPHAMAASGGFLSLRGALHRKARRCRFGLAQAEATASAYDGRRTTHRPLDHRARQPDRARDTHPTAARRSTLVAA